MTHDPAQHAVILVVDDDDAVRSSVRGFLEDCDFRVLEAADGATGLQLFERERPDLLLLDLRMPAPDGFDVLAETRGRQPDTPIVVLSGIGDVHDIVRALRLGAWDFVLKPVADLTLLEHAVNRALERSRMLRERNEYQRRLERDVAERTAELEQANADISRKAEEERVLGLLANLSIEPSSLDQYLDAALHTLLQSAPWLGLLDRGAILLSEEDSMHGGFQLHAGTGLPPLQLARCARLPPAWSRSTTPGAPLPTTYIGNCDATAGTPCHPDQSPHGHYQAPLVAGEWLLGMLLLYVPPGHTPSDQEIRFLNRAGESLSLGILRKRAEQRAAYLAFYDALTGLPNRQLFLDRVEQAINAVKRQRSSGALLFIDLDHFKTLNDGLGHASGDLLLKQVAARIHAALRDADTVARLGGDEFVVLLPLLQGPQNRLAQDAMRIAEKLREAVKQPFDLEIQQHTVTCSIGIALFPDDSNDVQELLRFADMAMYTAKREGRDTVRLFQPRMQTAVHARLNLNNQLRTALEHQEIVLHYQPQWDIDQNLLGAETLVRWRHPQQGLILPDDFIPLAEETGLILPLGERVLRESFRQLRQWEKAGYGNDLRWLYINVSAVQFRQPDFVELVGDLLHETGADPRRIGLEITESAVVHDIVNTRAKVEALKAKGIRISVDDFGTGYSSLTYLKSLPLDALKIDRSFVHDIVSSANGEAIVQTIIAMAANLCLDVIAEGVETQAQLDFLHHHGCRMYQGYLVARPLPPQQFIQLWKARARSTT